MTKEKRCNILRKIFRKIVLGLKGKRRVFGGGGGGVFFFFLQKQSSEFGQGQKAS